MDIYEWLVEQERETLLHLEDEQRSGTGVFEEMRKLENTAFGVPPCENCGELPCRCNWVQGPAKAGFHVGDTVKVTAEDFDGQEGELQAIEPLAFVGEFFGVYLESTQSIQFFCADEIEKVGK